MGCMIGPCDVDWSIAEKCTQRRSFSTQRSRFRACWIRRASIFSTSEEQADMRDPSLGPAHVALGWDGIRLKPRPLAPRDASTSHPPPTLRPSARSPTAAPSSSSKRSTPAGATVASSGPRRHTWLGESLTGLGESLAGLGESLASRGRFDRAPSTILAGWSWLEGHTAHALDERACHIGRLEGHPDRGPARLAQRQTRKHSRHQQPA